MGAGTGPEVTAMVRTVLGSARRVSGVVWLGAAAAAMLVLGCKPKAGAANDGGAEAAPAASVAVVEAGPAPLVGTNDSEVTHYPDQNAGSGETLTTRYATNARTEASGTGGKLVAQIKAETATQKIADHEGYDLVLFPDTNNAGQNLEGWVSHTALSGATGPSRPSGGSSSGGTSGSSSGGTAPATGYVCVKQIGPNKCPPGYVVSEAVCRVACTNPSECHGPQPKCVGGKCYASNGCQ